MKLYPSLWLEHGAADGGGAAPIPAAPVIPAAPAAPLSFSEKMAEVRGRVAEDGVSFKPPVDPAAPAPVVDPAAPPAPAADAPPADAPPVVDPANPDPAPVVEEAAAVTDFTLTLPAVRSGQEARDIPIDGLDQDAVERLQSLVNDGMRRDEFTRQMRTVESQREELSFVEDIMKADPAGFLIEHIPADVQLEVGLAILGQPGMLEQAVAIIEKWNENPQQREIDLLRAQQARSENREKVKETVEASSSQRAAVRAVFAAADAMATAVAPELREQFVDDVAAEIQRYANQNGAAPKLTPEQFVQVVGKRVQLYGLTPEQALAALKSPGRAASLPTARPSGEAATRIAAQVAAARTTGERLTAGAAVRRAAAVVPAPGTGAAPPAVAIPKGQKLDANYFRRVKEMMSGR